MADFAFYVGDTLSLTDYINSTDPAFGRYAGDVLTFSDGILFLLGTDPDERVFFSDSISFTLHGTPQVGVGDVLSLGDSAAGTLTRSQLASDTLALSDSISPSLSLALNLTDTLNLLDVVSNTLGSVFQSQTASAADTLSFLDSLSFRVLGAVAVGDNLSFSDLVVANFGSLPNSYLRRYLNDAT